METMISCLDKINRSITWQSYTDQALIIVIDYISAVSEYKSYLILPPSPSQDLQLYSASRRRWDPEHWSRDIIHYNHCNHACTHTRTHAQEVDLPARLHQSSQTLEKAHVAFVLQVVQHLLQVDHKTHKRVKAQHRTMIPVHILISVTLEHKTIHKGLFLLLRCIHHT